MSPKELRLPRPLSHSSITLYSECPQKYKFKYIDRIPEKPRHFFSFGSSVHMALEFFYGVKTPPAPSLEEVLAYYKEHWLSGGYKNKTQQDEYFEDGKNILTLFYKKHIQDYQIPFFVEYQFNLEVDGVPVTGKVDRVDKLPDGRLAILDYKTGKALAKGRTDNDAQLTMYQLACEELLGAQVGRLVFYHLPSLTEHTVERRSGDQVKELRDRIVSTAESISEGMFEPKPAERKCQWCDYKPICPIFKGMAVTSGFPLDDQVPVPPADLEAGLSELIDRYGDLVQKSQQALEDVVRTKQELLAAFEKKGYVRAFGRKYEIVRASTLRWEFPDKKKILDLIRDAGLYEQMLAPSGPKIQQLFSDPGVDPDLRAKLSEVSEKIETPDLKVKPI